MKLYILRHEDRTIDASFFGPLTKEGIINSNKLEENSLFKMPKILFKTKLKE